MKGGLLLPLPGSGNTPASSLDPLATTTHPTGGLAVQSCTGAARSGSSRSIVAACTPVVVQKSTTLPVKELDGFEPTGGSVILRGLVETRSWLLRTE